MLIKMKVASLNPVHRTLQMSQMGRGSSLMMILTYHRVVEVVMAMMIMMAKMCLSISWNSHCFQVNLPHISMVSRPDLTLDTFLAHLQGSRFSVRDAHFIFQDVASKYVCVYIFEYLDCICVVSSCRAYRPSVFLYLEQRHPMVTMPCG
jgi:hypothetical protein